LSGAAFKAADAASYDDVGEAFDRFAERFTGPLAERLVSLAGVRPGERVLDMGTGTGIVALRAAAAAGPAGRVLGIDLSPGMLEKAREKARTLGLCDRLEFRRADAEALDLPDCSRDVVLSLFALLHFPDPAAALRQMRRVLRPGGRLALGVGSPPPLFSRAGLRRGLRRIGERLRERRGLEVAAPQALEALVRARLPEAASDEVTPLEEQGHRKPRLVPALVREAGFVRVRTAWEGREAALDSPEEFFELQSTFSTRARKRLAAAPPDAARGVREELLAGASRVLSRGGRLAYRHAALFVVAERPAAGGV
jgi:SAM-dependent methyltransferase